MNCIKRGWLYTTRKKGKSFLLFCILFLIAVFVLSALAIDKASSLAQDNLRKSLGGEFTIGYDYSEANLFECRSGRWWYNYVFYPANYSRLD